jgi:hypothetical protein
MVMSGAWVRRAMLQAADGAQMPTKQTSLAFSAREAAIVIISLGVKALIAQSSTLQRSMQTHRDRTT